MIARMRISVRRIQQAIAGDFGVDFEALLSRRRDYDASHPRQYGMLLARELTPLSTVVIGKLFGRDHSTVLSNIKSARKRIEADPVLAMKIEARALLLACEPQKTVSAICPGFPQKTRESPPPYQQSIHNPAPRHALGDSMVVEA